MPELILRFGRRSERPAVLRLADDLVRAGLPARSVELERSGTTVRSGEDREEAGRASIPCRVLVRQDAFDEAGDKELAGGPLRVITNLDIDIDAEGRPIRLAYEAVAGGSTGSHRNAPYSDSVVGLSRFLASALMLAPVRLELSPHEKSPSEAAEDLVESAKRFARSGISASEVRCRRSRVSPGLLVRCLAGRSAKFHRQVLRALLEDAGFPGRLVSGNSWKTVAELLRRAVADGTKDALIHHLAGYSPEQLARLAGKSVMTESRLPPGEDDGIHERVQRAMRQLERGDLPAARIWFARAVRLAGGQYSAGSFESVSDDDVSALRQAQLFLLVLGDRLESWHAARLHGRLTAVPPEDRAIWNAAAHLRWAWRILGALVFAGLLISIKPFGFMELSSKYSASVFNAVLGPWYPDFVPVAHGEDSAGALSPENWPVTVVLIGDTYPYPPRFDRHASVLEALTLEQCRARHDESLPPPRAVFVDFYFADRREFWGAGMLEGVVRDYRSEHGIPLYVAVPETDTLQREASGARSELFVKSLVAHGARPVVTKSFLGTLKSNTYMLQYGSRSGARELLTERIWASPALALYNQYCADEDDSVRHAECLYTPRDTHRGMEVIWPGTEDLAVGERVSSPASVDGSVEPGSEAFVSASAGFFSRLWIAMWEGVDGLRLENPPIRTVLASELIGFGGGCRAELIDALSGKLVLYGGFFEGVSDFVVPPTHKGIAGVYMHAVALANLVDFGINYKSNDDILGSVLEFFSFFLLVILYFILVKSRWKRAETLLQRGSAGRRKAQAVNILFWLLWASPVIVTLFMMAGLLPGDRVAPAALVASLGVACLISVWAWEPKRREYRLLGNLVHVLAWSFAALFLNLFAALLAFWVGDLAIRNWVGLLLLGVLIPFQLGASDFVGSRPVGRGSMVAIRAWAGLRQWLYKMRGG